MQRPVRFVAEALDCSVSWDGTYKTVVILDLDELRETYDSQLTVFNLLLRDSAAMMEAGKNYATTERMDATVTVFDTLAGDKQYKGSLELEGVQNREAANYDVKVDLTDLMEVLQQSAAAYYAEQITNLAGLDFSTALTVSCAAALVIWIVLLAVSVVIVGRTTGKKRRPVV